MPKLAVFRLRSNTGTPRSTRRLLCSAATHPSACAADLLGSLERRPEIPAIATPAILDVLGLERAACRVVPEVVADLRPRGRVVLVLGLELVRQSKARDNGAAREIEAHDRSLLQVHEQGLARLRIVHG